jgi:hypothetical protein
VSFQETKLENKLLPFKKGGEEGFETPKKPSIFVVN